MNVSNADSVFTMSKASVDLAGLGKAHSMYFWPLGDLHLESPGHDAERFKDTLGAIRDCSKKHPTRVLLMGDMNDAISTKERKALAAAHLHDSTIDKLDRDIARSCDRLVDRLAFLPPNAVLGLLEGNHHWVFSTPDAQRGIVPGQTSTQYLAKRLNAPWLGFVSYIRIRIGVEGAGCHSALDVVACHGIGGGRLAGTSITNVDQLRTIFPEADIYLMGHDHKRGAVPVVSLTVPPTGRDPELKLREHEQWLGRTGSFLRGYVPNEASYVVRGLMRPASLGTLCFKVSVARIADKGGKKDEDGRSQKALRLEIHPEL